jgi:hypothetical protein
VPGSTQFTIAVSGVPALAADSPILIELRGELACYFGVSGASVIIDIDDPAFDYNSVNTAVISDCGGRRLRTNIADQAAADTTRLRRLQEVVYITCEVRLCVLSTHRNIFGSQVTASDASSLAAIQTLVMALQVGDHLHYRYKLLPAYADTLAGHNYACNNVVWIRLLAAPKLGWGIYLNRPQWFGLGTLHVHHVAQCCHQ